MAFDYAEMAATALEMIADFGAPAELVSKTQAYDPVSGTASGSLNSFPCTAVVIDAEKSFIDGTLVQAGAQVALVAPQGVSDLKPGMTLKWQGADWMVMVAKTLAPAGVAVLHELQVKK